MATEVSSLASCLSADWGEEPHRLILACPRFGFVASVRHRETPGSQQEHYSHPSAEVCHTHKLFHNYHTRSAINNKLPNL